MRCIHLVFGKICTSNKFLEAFGENVSRKLNIPRGRQRMVQSIARPASPPLARAQLSVVTEKLNVVTDGGRRKLSVVTDGTPEKGRRYHTFSHTERA